MHRSSRLLVLLMATAALAMSGRHPGTPAVAVRPHVLVRQGSVAQISLVRWAVGRYEAAGLRLPPIVVSFHPDTASCGGRFGAYGGGRVDMCMGSLVNLMTERLLLHEMGHAWSES